MPKTASKIKNMSCDKLRELDLTLLTDPHAKI